MRTSGDFDLPTPVIECETSGRLYSLGLTQTIYSIWRWLRQYVRR